MSKIMTDAIKKAAIDAIESNNPIAITFGKVISVTPLQISIEQKMTLEIEQLILSRNVTDFKLNMTVDHRTENELSHSHRYLGEKEFTVHNALVVGEDVILIRMQGGQKFLVFDRLG